jgi:hypothetical protein
LFVFPRQPGRLTLTATVRAAHGYRKSFPLTIDAVTPDAATAICERDGGLVRVGFALHHGVTRVRAQAPELHANGQLCEPIPHIDHGWPAPPPDSFGYVCLTEDDELTVTAAGLEASCQILR